MSGCERRCSQQGAVVGSVADLVFQRCWCGVEERRVVVLFPFDGLDSAVCFSELVESFGHQLRRLQPLLFILGASRSVLAHAIEGYLYGLSWVLGKILWCPIWRCRACLIRLLRMRQRCGAIRAVFRSLIWPNRQRVASQSIRIVICSFTFRLQTLVWQRRNTPVAVQTDRVPSLSVVVECHKTLGHFCWENTGGP